MIAAAATGVTNRVASRLIAECPTRWAFLEECPQSFGGFIAESGLEVFVDGCSVVGMSAVGMVNEDFGIADRLWAACKDTVGQLHRLLENLRGWGNPLEEPDLLSPHGGDRIANQKQFGKIPFSNFGLQDIRDESGQQTAAGFGESDLQIASTDCHIACSDDPGTSSVGPTVYRGDGDQG
jgi:hypothetical protein